MCHITVVPPALGARAQAARLQARSHAALCAKIQSKAATYWANRRHLCRRLHTVCVFIGHLYRRFLPSRLTGPERAWLFQHYCKSGELRDAGAVARLLSTMGITAGTEETMHAMRDVCFFSEGSLLSFRQFLLLAKYYKRRFEAFKRVPTALVAFVALGGGDENSDEGGEITADQLRAVVQEFKLTTDVEGFIRAVDESDDGLLQYDEFKVFIGRDGELSPLEAARLNGKWDPLKELDNKEELLASGCGDSWNVDDDGNDVESGGRSSRGPVNAAADPSAVGSDDVGDAAAAAAAAASIMAPASSIVQPHHLRGLPPVGATPEEELALLTPQLIFRGVRDWVDTHDDMENKMGYAPGEADVVAALSRSAGRRVGRTSSLKRYRLKQNNNINVNARSSNNINNNNNAAAISSASQISGSPSVLGASRHARPRRTANWEAGDEDNEDGGGGGASGIGGGAGGSGGAETAACSKSTRGSSRGGGGMTQAALNRLYPTPPATAKNRQVTTSHLSETAFGTAPRFKGDGALMPLPKASGTSMLLLSPRSHFRDGPPTVRGVQKHLRKLGELTTSDLPPATPPQGGFAHSPRGAASSGQRASSRQDGRPASQQSGVAVSAAAAGGGGQKWFERDPFAPAFSNSSGVSVSGAATPTRFPEIGRRGRAAVSSAGRLAQPDFVF